ncbi:MAG: hypothetical protein K2P81_02115 [Bacteriovoracaceae bacterium]|nr:hypothetical protein [Bacteriovoracaceae bacterium]
MKSLIILALLSSCAAKPLGIRVAQNAEELKACDPIPTFVALSCGETKSCEECLKVMSAEAHKMGGNAILLTPQKAQCDASQMTAQVCRCP